MFGFLNIAMLAGLAGLALPILAHLLSKRKYDVVDWGAMQFLELGKKTRRRIRLEELLLLLLRMGLIALLVFAVARPWARGSLFAGLGEGPHQDVVIVLDGSYSMGWEGEAATPHAEAVQWGHDYLETLRSGDTIAILDARDQVRRLLDPPTSDRNLASQTLDEIAPPAGTSKLLPALNEAIAISLAGKHLHREIVIVTDGQALPWTIQDEAAWNRVTTQLEEAAVVPRLWYVQCDHSVPEDVVNVSVDKLRLSREFTVPDFAIRVQTTIRQSGGTNTRKQVFFEVDGQRLDEKTLLVNLSPDGESPVEFEHRFAKPGSYVISVVVEPDQLPGDDQADAAVVITEGIPVLLVDGDPQADPVKRETFFAKSALTPQDVSSPWVQADVVDARAFSEQDLDGKHSLFLCNVSALKQDQLAAVEDFVARGGGLVIAPGDLTNPDAWNPLAQSPGLLPATLGKILSEQDSDTRPVRIDNESLQLPWIEMFRAETVNKGFDLTQVRFSQWWKLSPAVPRNDEPQAQEADTAPIVAARLDNGDPYIITRHFGRGMVVLLAGPIDDDWSTLPGRRALAPLLHELVFLMAARQTHRNVDVGAPLITALPEGAKLSEFKFIGPHGEEIPAVAAGDELNPMMQCQQTFVPGVYRLTREGFPESDPFVVNFDRAESDLTRLDGEAWNRLITQGPLKKLDSLDELLDARADDAPYKEIWAALMLIVIGLLALEIYFTRRLVQAGHEAVGDEGSSPVMHEAA